MFRTVRAPTVAARARAVFIVRRGACARAMEAGERDAGAMGKNTMPSLADAEAMATQREIEVRRRRRGEETNRRACARVMLTSRAARAGA